jgi:predicted lactoylglutathione lyase
VQEIRRELRHARRMKQRVTLITLGYHDYQRARDFYTAMGWDVHWTDDDVIFFQAGPMIFALWDREKLAKDSEVQDSGGWGGVTLAYNTNSPDEVDEVLAQAEAAGGTVPRPGGKTFWGGYSGIFIDTEGHPWEVAHNPRWTVRDDGSISLD